MATPLAQLTHLVPPPSSGREKDWERVRQVVGTALPDDYKEFIRTYGGSNWDDYLYVLEPDCPNNSYDLLTWNRHAMEDLEDLWEFEEKPEQLEEPGCHLIPWATTDNGESLYWLVRPEQQPEHWTVMVNEARGGSWEHIELSCTGFLVAALTREFESRILSSRFPLAQHQFRQLQAR